jgi:hypothetical protein
MCCLRKQDAGLTPKRCNFRARRSSIRWARVHARAGEPAAFAGYLGKAATFDEAIGRFAVAYADQTKKDHRALLDAIDNGRILATPGV